MIYYNTVWFILIIIAFVVWFVGLANARTTTGRKVMWVGGISMFTLALFNILLKMMLGAL